ncbi:hypothetical protein [Actinomadura spongiicola]|uniref:hypothetical protein n=1 Tax=Actinomadura spongiicola TaxID=2303421 RepID=UPI0018F1764D|nr:hypothetical protein [Actinomadura spongiicola]
MTIASGIVPGGGEADPDAIGARYYRLYQQPDRVEEVIGDLNAFRALVAEHAPRHKDQPSTPTTTDN